jgi:dihydrofolate synthase/folylpolyglutamate synthase
MKLKTLEECEHALRAFVPPPRSQRQKYNLRHIRAFMSVIGNPQNSYQVIHVAGTSGKTSTCYYLAALCAGAGLKTGLTVSPHITSVTERIQINLVPASEAVFAEALGEFLEIVKKAGIGLTYFEVLIAFAYWYFAREKVDVAVIETGLGGLLDGSNVVHNPAKVCVLTDIGLDHTAVLGNTIPEIAAQKAGIIGEENEVFCWQQAKPVMSVFRNAAKMQRSALHVVKEEQGEMPARMPQFQKRNFSLAATAAGWVLAERFRLKLTKQQLHRAAGQVIPARMERFMQGQVHLTLDGAHNPQKKKALVGSFLALRGPSAHPAVLFACVEGPDTKIEQTVAELLHLAPSRVIISSFKSLQDMRKVSVPPSRLQKVFVAAGYDAAKVVTDPQAALTELLSSSKEILVTGSLYLIFEVRGRLAGV